MRGLRRASSVGVLGVACLVLAATARAQTAGPEVYDGLRVSPRVRVVVALREPRVPATSMTLRAGAVATIQEGVLSRLSEDEFRLTHQFVAVSAVAGDVSPGGLARLLSDPDVVRVDLDIPVHATLAESVPLIKADQVHNMGVTGRGISVAVLDSGADAGHPDLKDAITAEQCFCTGGDGAGCCPNGSAQQSGAGAAKDENGHGTNVTGIIASRGRVAPQGVAPDSTIVSIRVLDRTGGGSTSGIISGLDYILTQRPEVKVVNMSLEAGVFSGTCDSAASFTLSMAQAVNSLKSRGTITLASSGNDHSTTQIGSPACLSGVVAVGAVYKGNVGAVSFGCVDSVTKADQVACFSNSNSKVDLMAPGGVIAAPGVGGGVSGYVGTSQACPMAAGAAALLLSSKPGLTPDAIRDALKGTGVSVTDPKNGLSFRRIDVQAALAAAH